MSTRNVLLVCLTALLIVGMCLGTALILGSRDTTPTPKVVEVVRTVEVTCNTCSNPIEPTQAPAEPTAIQAPIEPAPEPTLAPIVSNPPGTTKYPVCQGWNAGETRNLLPDQMAMGDVVVAGTPYYDNGSGEGTVVVNLSNEPISIYAEWGAGCAVSDDVSWSIDHELDLGCGDPVDGCEAVRIVRIENSGITQEFYR